MRIADMNWMQVEERASIDDRCVLPIGSVEQHAYLSLAVDAILAERVATDAAEPVGTPVFPVLPYGMASGYADFPGTVSLRLSTYAAVLNDILDSVKRAGFRRILIVNGHGGNSPITAFISEWLNENRDATVRFHDWWRAPKVWALVQATDPIASHASWMENFPWTRLADVALPRAQKPMIDLSRLSQVDAGRKRAMIGDGNYGGDYQKSDEVMLGIWRTAVEEVREQLEGDWK